MLAEEDWFYVQIEARVVDTGLDRSVNLRDEITRTGLETIGESFEGAVRTGHTKLPPWHQCLTQCVPSGNRLTFMKK
jgi:hypothetical protein